MAEAAFPATSYMETGAPSFAAMFIMAGVPVLGSWASKKFTSSQLPAAVRILSAITLSVSPAETATSAVLPRDSMRIVPAAAAEAESVRTGLVIPEAMPVCMAIPAEKEGLNDGSDMGRSTMRRDSPVLA